MKGLLAFHVNCTAPYLMTSAKPYEAEDFELLSTVLSALQWRRAGGVIAMETDPVGARYYRSLGLEALWNGGMGDTLHLDITGIDPVSLWAAGKLFALARQKAPCVMLDTDFIVWEDLSERLAGSKLTVAHREALYPDVYPPREHFRMKPAYTFPPEWDWSQRPCNTAFAYFGDEALRKEYTEQAIAFMRGVENCGDPLTYMVFAEQRLLAMCAAGRGVAIGTLLEEERLFEPQSGFTHLWGYKQQMRDDPGERADFCRRCIARIRADFPAHAYLLDRLPICAYE